jgi:hypothetical protein
MDLRKSRETGDDKKSRNYLDSKSAIDKQQDMTRLHEFFNPDFNPKDKEPSRLSFVLIKNVNGSSFCIIGSFAAHIGHFFPSPPTSSPEKHQICLLIKIKIHAKTEKY